MGWCIYREIGIEFSDRLRLVINIIVYENFFLWCFDWCFFFILILWKWNILLNSLKKIKFYGIKYSDWCRNI